MYMESPLCLMPILFFVAGIFYSESSIAQPCRYTNACKG